MRNRPVALVQLEATVIYMHIRMTHNFNIVYFCEAKYEKLWYFHHFFQDRGQKLQTLELMDECSVMHDWKWIRNVSF